MAELRVASNVTDPGPGGGDSRAKDDNPPPRELPLLVHGWLRERLQEGDRINRADPFYTKASDLVADLMGDQPTGPNAPDSRRVVLNQTRKAINVHASILSDIKPLWEYRTENPNGKSHARAYNQLLTNWWLRTFADMELADGARYSLTIGSGDVLQEFDPHFGPGGDVRLQARDWRDTLSIRPEKTRSVQDWEGVIIAEQHTPAKLRATFPGCDRYIAPGGSAAGVGVFTRYRKLTRPEAEVSTLSGLGAKGPDAKYTAQNVQPQVMLYRAFYRDRSINMTAAAVLVGPLNSNWAYWVQPGEPLYPRGRCTLFTELGVISDGPNPFYHARWPLSRLTLQHWPWLMNGYPLTFDLRALAQILNITVNDILQVFSQWVHRGTVWGKNAPDSLVNRFDPTRPNWKMKVNSLVGTGFQMQDGPNLPPWTLQFLDRLFAKWDELSGVANLTQLMQLRQSPSAETLDKYMEAMTPEIRMEVRQIEAHLREHADMYIYNVSQFYSREKRRMLLGDQGEVLADSDLDPETMIPSMAAGTPGYVRELDSNLSRWKRASFFLQQFGFYVAPGSLLNLHAQEKKMMYLQLSRQGYVDFWTLGEMNEIPNLGEPPMVMLPKNLTDDQVRTMQLPIDPQTGQPQLPTELRRPITITERLLAQQQLGLGQTASPVGRKASGQEQPQIKQRSDGSTTVSESG